MTLSEFKAFLESKKNGDIKLPSTNEEYQPLLQESLEYVAKQCNPITLRTNDLTEETLRFLNLNLQIRKPIAAIVNEENIDIDEQLVYAVAYDLLSRKTRNKQDKFDWQKDRDKEINTYTMNNYKLLVEMEIL